MTDACDLHGFMPCDGPTEAEILAGGNALLDARFPLLTRIHEATLVEPASAPPSAPPDGRQWSYWAEGHGSDMGSAALQLIFLFCFFAGSGAIGMRESGSKRSSCSTLCSSSQPSRSACGCLSRWSGARASRATRRRATGTLGAACAAGSHARCAARAPRTGSGSRGAPALSSTASAWREWTSPPARRRAVR